jgi:hypothetical protein
MPSRVHQLSDELHARLDQCLSLEDVPAPIRAGVFLGPVISRHDPEHGWISLTTAPLCAGTIVSTMDGTRTDRAWRYSCQIAPKVHVLGPPYINHVCEDPNLHLDTDRALLVARRDLAAGEELSLNYLTFEARMSRPFACACGCMRCYGTIAGFELLSAEEQMRLAEEFDLPWYLHGAMQIASGRMGRVARGS